MKKLLVLGLIATSTLAMAELRFGTVDMMVLVRNHQDYEANKRLITSTERDYQKKLDAMKSEAEAIQAEGKKLADEYRNPMISQSAKAKIESDIAAIQAKFMNIQQKLRNEAMRSQQELSELEARMLKAQADDVRASVAKYAEENNYDYIFDASAAVFSKKSADLTNEILKAMGVDLKKLNEKAKENDESK